MPATDIDLSGKRVLITGTGRGQGEAALRHFCALGASVVGCDAIEGSAESVAETVRAEGGTASARTVDLGDPDDARSWVEWGAEQLGGIDVVYNNAGRPVFVPFASMTVDDWRSTIRNELDLVFYTTSAAWPHLIESGNGSIISTASVAASLGTGILPQVAHSAAKGGVLAMTRQLAAEGAGLGIRANCVSPGFVQTPGTQDVPPPFVQQLLRAEHMIHSSVPPTSVAVLAAYLASDASSYVTGANFPIDAGWSAGSALD